MNRNIFIIFMLIALSSCGKISELKEITVNPPQKQTCLDKYHSLEKCKKR